MEKGPLVYAAIILAAILMAVSSLMMVYRNVFMENKEMVTLISGIIAAGVILVLILMLMRLRKQIQ